MSSVHYDRCLPLSGIRVAVDGVICVLLILLGIDAVWKDFAQSDISKGSIPVQAFSALILIVAPIVMYFWELTRFTRFEAVPSGISASRLLGSERTVLWEHCDRVEITPCRFLFWRRRLLRIVSKSGESIEIPDRVTNFDHLVRSIRDFVSVANSR